MNNEKKTISFDFDGTLVDEFGGFPCNHQKNEIQSLAKKYISEGHEVIIITKRYGPKKSYKGAKNEHIKVNELANKLGIEKIYFTDREMKFSHIINLKVDVHFENDDYEVSLIKQACKEKGHKCLVIPVEDPNWRELEKSILGE